MKRKVKKLLNKAREINYHRNFNTIAITTLKSIESQTNYKLTSKLKSQIDDYATEVLGSKKYAPWLYTYTAYNQTFKEGWIPDNYYGLEVLPRINKDFREISPVKTISKRVLQSDLFPDKFYLLENVLYDINYKVVSKERTIEKLFEDGEELFFKKNESSQGKGIIKLKKNNFNLEEFYKLDNAVIQRPIEQHEWFNDIITGSVATLRITTLRGKHNEIDFIGSFLRIGGKKSEYVDSISDFRISVNKESGKLNDFGIDRDWKKHYYHPDTGYEFKNQQIPNFDKAVNECKNIHKRIPHVGIIAWDVIINKDNKIEIMEWNAKHPDIKFIEMSVGPCFTNYNWEKLHKNH